jgi:hypothetical protein
MVSIMATHEEYARRIHANGTVTRYRTREEYQRGRFAATGSMAAQRSSINRAVGGNIV